MNPKLRAWLEQELLDIDEEVRVANSPTDQAKKQELLDQIADLAQGDAIPDPPSVEIDSTRHKPTTTRLKAKWKRKVTVGRLMHAEQELLAAGLSPEAIAPNVWLLTPEDESQVAVWKDGSARWKLPTELAQRYYSGERDEILLSLELRLVGEGLWQPSVTVNPIPTENPMEVVLSFGDVGSRSFTIPVEDDRDEGRAESELVPASVMGELGELGEPSLIPVVAELRRRIGVALPDSFDWSPRAIRSGAVSLDTIQTVCQTGFVL